MVIKLTSFILKIIGILTMACDHIGYAILGKFSFLNLIGRIAFPIFAFQATEGFVHTKDLKKHIRKLLIFGCISQIPFMLFLSKFSESIFTLNIFFTLILGLIAISLYKKTTNKVLAFAYILLFGILAELVNVDYGMYGIFLIFLFYIFKEKKFLMNISVILLTIAKYLPSILTYAFMHSRFYLCILFTCLSLIFILFYNKKEGPKAKYLFYIFYPLHLVILCFFN